MKYIELTSFYRDRQQHPNPSSFITGKSDLRTDLPLYTFSSDIDTSINIIGGTCTAPIFDKPVGINYVIQQSISNEQSIVSQVYPMNLTLLRDK